MDRRNFLKALGFTTAGALIPFRVIPEETFVKEESSTFLQLYRFLRKEWYNEVNADEFLKLKVVTDIETLYIDVPTIKVIDYENSCVTWMPCEIGKMKIKSTKDFIIKDILVKPPLEIKESFEMYGINKDWSFCNKDMYLEIPENTDCLLGFNGDGLFKKM